MSGVQREAAERDWCPVCRPAEVFGVGEFLRSELRARRLSRAKLAVAMGGDPVKNLCVVELVMDVNEPGMWLGVETARQLETALGISAEFFLRIDAAWHLRQFKDYAPPPASPAPSEEKET